MYKTSFLALLLFIPVNAFANSVEWANGQWALDPEYASPEHLKDYNCKNSPSTIETNPETKTYKITYDNKSGDTAQILSSSDRYFEIKYDGEERTMDGGEPHIWFMFFTDEDHFVWVRKDWIENGEIKGATPGRIRCDRPSVS